ncbi:MAG: hypothetical protein R3B06_10125 [Kofleriaceae bacterium]
MAALVLQSYRTDAVAPWLARCMASVRAWAAEAGHRYEFIDDRLFDAVPGWFRDRCGAELLPQTDLARLLAMRARLRAGVARVIWLDADVVVCAPARLRLDGDRGFALCAETWLDADADGGLRASRRLNNAAMVMDAGNPLLDFYIHAVLENAAHLAPGAIGKLEFGPQLLTRLAQVTPLPTIGEVGMLSPPLARAVAAGGGPACATFARAHGQAIAAVNLCASLVDDPRGFDAATVARALDHLMATGGDVINRHLSAAT